MRWAGVSYRTAKAALNRMIHSGGDRTGAQSPQGAFCVAAAIPAQLPTRFTGKYAATTTTVPACVQAAANLLRVIDGLPHARPKLGQFLDGKANRWPW